MLPALPMPLWCTFRRNLKMLLMLSLLTVSFAGNNPLAYVGQGHNTAVLELAPCVVQPGVDPAEVAADLWIEHGGDSAYRQEAIAWFGAVISGEAEAALKPAMPADARTRYDEYLALVQDYQGNLDEVLAEIDALDAQTRVDFSGNKRKVLFIMSATLRSSIEFWTTNEIALVFPDESGEIYYDKDGEIDAGEVAESDAKGAIAGGVGGVLAGGSWGGTVSFGSLTVPGGVVGGVAGVIAGAAAGSIMEYVEQDAVRDYIEDNPTECGDELDNNGD